MFNPLRLSVRVVARAGLFLSLLLPLFPRLASAAEPVACYWLEMQGSPEAESRISSPRKQIWCYQRLESPTGALYVYNADSNRVKPELAAVLEADGTLVHGSLSAGKTTIHRVRAAGFNPLPAPLREPGFGLRASAIETAPELRESAKEVLNLLLSRVSSVEIFAIEPGQRAASVPTSALPWRGYWWPYKGQPLSGTSGSPLAKYDRFVRGQTGTSPRAASWENTYHRYKGINWEGHCNGWAASAILRRQPTFARRDPTTGIVFSAADQKGVLAEMDYCAIVAFYGRRYNGRRGQDIRDIYPALFHQTLTYYIGELGKPVAFDYMRTSAVDNHIVSAYEMDVERRSATSFRVTAKLTVHKYDSSRSHPPAPAPTYTRTYRYTLNTNDNGEITGGSWLSTNPDFIWVPLAVGDCESNNPRVSEQWVSAILDLPAD